MASNTRKKKVVLSDEDTVDDHLASLAPLNTTQPKSRPKTTTSQVRNNQSKTSPRTTRKPASTLNAASNLDKPQQGFSKKSLIQKPKETSQPPVSSTLSAASGSKNTTEIIIEEQEQLKRKNDFDDSTIASKAPRLNASILNKVIQYSQQAFEEASATKEAILRVETILNKFINEQAIQDKASEDLDIEVDNKNSRKNSFWYTRTISKACLNLFQSDKDPTDQVMRDAIYTALVNDHPEQIQKIERTNDGWNNYWNEVLQSATRADFRVKRATYVRNVKNTITNVFGKVFIGNAPGHRATQEQVLAWKTTENVRWAKDNLWNAVDPDGDKPRDTYMSRIIKEALKKDERTADNCAFVAAIVDLMFDSDIQTTTLTGELIVNRMSARAKEREEALQESTVQEEKENPNDEKENPNDEKENPNDEEENPNDEEEGMENILTMEDASLSDD